MRLHILGICGTFMAGIALIARELGHQVSGSDAGVYPPMSTQLRDQGIDLMEGDDPGHLDPEPDLVIIGNAYSRGHLQVEYVLDRGLDYCSGPAWLAEQVLHHRWVLAVSGTHGKTTTTSLLSWILEQAGLQPGFLIGGVAENFGLSARLGSDPFFVIEADEYDTAFFDKRSKFVHYRPRTLILNNLEYDHADIFPDLAAIQRQFHHLLRTVPSLGLILHPPAQPAIDATLAMGCWTPTSSFSSTVPADWNVSALRPDFSAFSVDHQGQAAGQVEWDLIGRFNAENALAAIAAAQHAGVQAEQGVKALTGFKSVKRRLQCLGQIAGVSVYDDFAHHPTAIQQTLEALRLHVGQARIIVILEPRSNTMRMGVHKDTLAAALDEADRCMLYTPADMQWDLARASQSLGERRTVFSDTETLLHAVTSLAQSGDHILIMSNGGFENLQQRLIEDLKKEIDRE